ncbi:MAG: hydantoinase/oxoprolinase family protein [Acidobacteriota bacterium]|nr:hydantoinase/oxoprolinase family protein [Acidobacteriota bacterium]
MRIAIDTGGTFTDCVFLRKGRLEVLKILSTPANPAEAILTAVRQIDPGPQVEIRHGTTVGTNTLLERSGARVALVTTRGFEDVIAIGRQARQNLYDWLATPEPPLVPPELRFGAEERTLWNGEVAREVDSAELQSLLQRVSASRPEAIALCLLFPFANPSNERRIAGALASLGVPLSVSHEILPEFREYERASTVVVNAYLAPRMGSYLRDLGQAVDSEFPDARLHVMQSSGGIVSAGLAAREPARTILSGPAGGVVGAYQVARLAGFERIITFDMGGTSTDVALVDSKSNGGLGTTNESVVAGHPIGVPMLNIHTVGSGGGSLAWFDEGNALRVGPQSAGADPGPICYGRGTRATVTDADLALGRLDPEFFLGGGMRLDEERTLEFMTRQRDSLPDVDAFAIGIVRVVQTTMEKAIRVISIERGHDPRDFTLVSFGGAGPVHACAMARALRIPRVVVPRFPGALSALGILLSDVVRDSSRTVMMAPDDRRLEGAFRDLEKRASLQMRAEGWKGVGFRSVDVRYVGQGYELNVPWGPGLLARFHDAHRKRYGYSDVARPVEVVNVRVRLVAPTGSVPLRRRSPGGKDASKAIVKQRRAWFAGRRVNVPVYDREQLRPGNRFTGSALVVEYSATTVVLPGCRARVDGWGNLIIEVS